MRVGLALHATTFVVFVAQTVLVYTVLFTTLVTSFVLVDLQMRDVLKTILVGTQVASHIPVPAPPPLPRADFEEVGELVVREG